MGSEGGGVVLGSGPAGTTSITPVAYGATGSPGYNFLTSNASAARCVVACMKISYPGAESTRSGRIHYGQTSSGLIGIGSATTVDSVAQALPMFERTPASTIELTFKPNDADQLYSKPGVAVSSDSAKNNKVASLVAAWAGLPVATGLTVHLTAVYEWQPAVGDGVAVPNLSKSRSNNSLDEVVNYLIDKGHTFIRSAAAAATSGITAGALAAAYGSMDPRPQVRRLGMY
jgi:hypothetical protein